MAIEIENLNKVIEALKEEKYSLLKIISHDIRSPFNRLYALLQLFEMESENISEQQHQYINSMYLSLLSGLEMIQNLKDLREIDFESIEVHQETIPFSELIKDVLRIFSQRIQLKGQSVNYEVNENNSVYGDPFLIGRILESLISNALKFSKSEKGIKIIYQAFDDNFEIIIKDYGEGIKPQEESMLFQRFSKLSSIATGGEGSLGLGLYNARFFAGLMGGDVFYKRPNEMGSEFILRLPNH